MRKLDNFTLSDFSENSFLINMNEEAQFSDRTAVFLSLSEFLRKTVNWINVIPAEQSISIKYDSLDISVGKAKKIIEEKIAEFRFSERHDDKPLVSIPVYYSEEFGLDIKDIATKYSCSYQEIADLQEFQELNDEIPAYTFKSDSNTETLLIQVIDEIKDILVNIKH